MQTLNNHKSNNCNLPRKGWIHECIICEIPTSHCIIYKNYKIYVCKPCNNNKTNNIYDHIRYYKRKRRITSS